LHLLDIIEVDYRTPVLKNGKCASKHDFPMLVGKPKFHSWGRCTIALNKCTQIWDPILPLAYVLFIYLRGSFISHLGM